MRAGQGGPSASTLPARRGRSVATAAATDVVGVDARVVVVDAGAVVDVVGDTAGVVVVVGAGVGAGGGGLRRPDGAVESGAVAGRPGNVAAVAA
ncbi:MAG TPA: hypothetical protein VGI06_02465, partial [Acidimicrobiales bacterium]